MTMRRVLQTGAIAAGFALILSALQSPMNAGRQAGDAIKIDADDLAGVVSSAAGPEAGVWVIAETTDLPTKYRKIVVTDDRGRYLLPDLPNANYEIWVRGYGLVDSEHVKSRRGQRLNLRAVVAPSPAAAALYYPGNYWFSLLEIPKASEFPMRVPPPPARPGAAPVGGAPAAATQERTFNNQGEFVFQLKRGCEACHQMGVKAT